MPFTLFCNFHSPEKAHHFLEEHNAAIEGDLDKWSAQYVFPRQDGGEPATINIKFDRQWCSPPNWPQQLDGLQNYIRSFQLSPERRGYAAQLASEFEFALGVVAEPEISSGDDPRLEVITAVAQEMEATIFTPGALLNSRFYAFATQEGEQDDDVELPAIKGIPTPIAAVANDLAAVEVAGHGDLGDGDFTWEAPTSDRVVRRLFALQAIAARGLLDMNLAHGNTPAYDLQQLLQWWEALELTAELDPSEQRLLYTEEGKLPEQDVINSVWRLEGLVVLAWALQLAEIPPYDEVVHTDELMQSLCFLDVAGSREMIDEAKLQSQEQLEQYNADIFAFHWRMVDFRIRPQPHDFAEVRIGPQPFDLSWARLRDGDLEIGQQAIAEADSEHVQMAMSIAAERHTAANWLLGEDPIYSRVTPST